MTRTLDKESVKKYLDLLEGLGWDDKKRMAVYAFEDIDHTRNCLDMVCKEPDGIWKGIGKLRNGAGKNYAILAVSVAKENMEEVRKGSARMDFLVDKGTKDSVMGFINGIDNALERPFPVIAVEKEMKNIMDHLAGAFAAVDIGIGRIEEEVGMACKDGHYWDSASGTLWEGGAGEQAWLDVLWPMRMFEKAIISAQDTVHYAACRIDGMRPNAESVIKKHVLVPGLDWMQEKERQRIAALISGQEQRPAVYLWNGERMRAEAENLCAAEATRPLGTSADRGQNKGNRKPSLRNRLESAKIKCRKIQNPADVRKQKSRVGEVQR